MKKLYLYLAGVCLVAGMTSCKTLVPTAMFKTYTSGVDYYSAGMDGKVFITESNSVSFDYIPIGSLYVEQSSGYSKDAQVIKKTVINHSGDPIYGAQEKEVVKSIKGEWVTATYYTVVSAAAEEAVRMGGDGIINLKLTEAVGSTGLKNPAVTGMVIKRK